MHAPSPFGHDGGAGVVWHAPHVGDLDANVVHLPAGEAIAEHVNGEVDVLVCVTSGSATLVVDGHRHPLVVGSVAVVPVGARRGVEAGPDGVVYLSAHRARSGPRIRSTR